MSLAVVKLGGSTARAAEMGAWIDALAAARLPLAVVPGGGPFADLVRETQKRIGFSDAAAHAMAILGMEQFGHVIVDRHDRLAAAHTLDEMHDIIEQSRIPVWMPASLALGAADIPKSWDITSDSLAAWLAGRLDAGALLLIKQTDAVTGVHDLDSLVADGVVDPEFGRMLPAAVALYLAGPRHISTAASEFAAGDLPGTPIGRQESRGRRVAGR